MAEIYNPEDFVYFVLLPEYLERSSSSFYLSYNDMETGEFINFLSPRGETQRYKFHKAFRTIRIPKKQTALIEVIRNHPLCQASKNSRKIERGGVVSYPDALFKEIKEAEDAKVSINIAKLRNEAMSAVFSIMDNESDIEDLATVLDIKGSGELSHNKVILYAERNPEELLELIKSPDYKSKALAKKALRLGILQKQGLVYVCGETEFGTDFEEVVKSIISNDVKRSILESKIK